MADRPDRPGKHKARHRKPSRLSRAGGRAPQLRRPVVITAAGGVLAAAAVAGTVVVAAGGEDGSTPQASEPAPMEYQRSEPDVSRDAQRTPAGPSLRELKADAMGDYSYGASRDGSRVAVEQEELATSDSDPRELAQAMLAQYGWDSSQFSCLDDLWYGESQWDPTAENPYSGAYGIPQALPPEKMAAAGPDWETNPATQIEWGLGYIQDRYGSPCAANDFKLGNGWY